MANSTVCVAVDHLYDDSMGSYSIFHLWDGEKVTTEGGMYSDLAYNHYTVDATREQLLAASEHARSTATETYNYNKYANGGRGADTYVGCVVILARSRKAPNGVELTVTDFHDRYYNNRFGNWVDEKITVTDGIGNYYTVSVGCIKAVIKGVKNLPFWVI